MSVPNTSHFISKLISTEISWFFVKPSEFRTRKCKQRVIRKWKILICNEPKILKLLKLKFNSIRIDSYFSFFYLGCTLNFYFLNDFFDRPVTPAVAHCLRFSAQFFQSYRQMFRTQLTKRTEWKWQVLGLFVRSKE